MNRRRFIRISILSLIGAVAASIIAFYNFESFVFRMLKRDLKTLNVEEQDLKRFIADARKTNYWKKNSIDSKKRAFLLLFYFIPNIGLPYQFKFAQIKGRIVGTFLLSTDFFLNKMDESKKIKYIGFYDPYLRPCMNPFSNLYYNDLNS